MVMGKEVSQYAIDMNGSNILLTGASGFVGRFLALHLDGSRLRTYGRSPIEGIDWVKGDLSREDDYSNALVDIDVVIHLAGVSSADGVDTDELISINVDATLNLAFAAREAGVKRFIFMSSAKVFGDVSEYGGFDETAQKSPTDAYGYSKSLAEDRLVSDLCLSGMDVIIVRSPVVYGPGVTGNFGALLKLARLNVPLPFGDASAGRSVIYIGNLIDFLKYVAEADSVASGIYHVSDEDVPSFSQLVVLIRNVRSKRGRVFPIPASVFIIFLRLLGRERLYSQIFEPFRLNCEKTYLSTGWRPPYTLHEGLENTISIPLQGELRD